MRVGPRSELLVDHAVGPHAENGVLLLPGQRCTQTEVCQEAETAVVAEVSIAQNASGSSNARGSRN